MKDISNQDSMSDNSESDYDKQLKKLLLPMLRRRSLFWWGRAEAKRQAKVAPGLFECAWCGKGKSYTSSQVHVDHRIPIINPKTSWVDWDSFIKSLFCNVDNLQVLCIQHHTEKTQVENQLRQKYKKSRKSKK